MLKVDERIRLYVKGYCRGKEIQYISHKSYSSGNGPPGVAMPIDDMVRICARDAHSEFEIKIPLPKELVR